MSDKSYPRYTAIQHNADGRPCGWGDASTKEVAVEVALKMYYGHSCYPGESKGELTVYRIESENDKGVVEAQP